MELTKLNISGYEQVVQATDKDSGLVAIISVHNTNLGPAVGGTRLYPYVSEKDALTDVLRLSKGMTYKSALAGINFGGGKSVIVADPANKTPDMLKAFGKFVDTFGGQYYCAEDVNTSTADMNIIHGVTKNVLGLEDAGGDPSPHTALGVVTCIRVTAQKLGIKLSDLRVAIQGIGQVGADMTRLLRKDGATVYVADLRRHVVEALCEETGAIAVDAGKIVTQECDIFAPCAMGAILNDDTIPTLNCKAVVGAANNQLADMKHGDMLKDKGILYAPDYLVNAGGIINVFFEHQPEGYNAEKARAKVLAIGDTLLEIYKIAEKQDISPAIAADKLAEERFLKGQSQSQAS